MKISGIAKKDRKTKNLLPRLTPKDIPIILHTDLDRLCAMALLEKKIKAVINSSSSITGKFLNFGPEILLRNNILILDNIGEKYFNEIEEGAKIEIEQNKIFHKEKFLCEGEILTYEIFEERIKQAKKNLDIELNKFVENTLAYFKKEKDILLEDVFFPDVGIKMKGKHVLVVVRGPDYEKDLKALYYYIKEKKPIIIAVDGGADAVLDFNIKPDIIIGDMDSVSDKALKSGAKILVHAYPDGTSPGLEKVKKLNINYITIPFPGTSEDIALLFAYHGGCEMIVGVGMHFSLIEFLEKGRSGMSSTFLVRLKVGSILFDAKGVSKLYRSSPNFTLFFSLLLAGLVPIIIVLFTSPAVKPLLRLIKMYIERKIGI